MRIDSALESTSEYLKIMIIRLLKKTTCAFSNLEALVVIVITIALSFVLVPALAYQMGWMEPAKRDIDINLRRVIHPGATFVPKNKRNEDDQQKNTKNDK